MSSWQHGLVNEKAYIVDGMLWSCLSELLQKQIEFDKVCSSE